MLSTVNLYVLLLVDKLKNKYVKTDLYIYRDTLYIFVDLRINYVYDSRIKARKGQQKGKKEMNAME